MSVWMCECAIGINRNYIVDDVRDMLCAVRVCAVHVQIYMIFSSILLLRLLLLVLLLRAADSMPLSHGISF